MGKIVVVGSMAYDSVKTPSGQVDRALGGSANYFSLAASLFAPVQAVGVVGQDYNPDDLQLLKVRGVDVSGVERIEGKTFHWAGEYAGDLNEAKTLATELNVFETFKPKLPASYKTAEYVFLANIDPVLQLDVLDQVQSPKIVAADTMNFWIKTKLDDLKKVLKRLDILFINEGEAKLLTDATNAVSACERLCEMGPKSVVIKRGEYGFLLFTDGNFHALPAFPIKQVVDPTGAGDTFAGGFMGYLAKNDLGLKASSMGQAAVFGTLLASFTVQDFSVGALKDLTAAQVEKRHLQYKEVVSLFS
ncbi:MAG: bifunctional hydroxymethylpyrimidine kinase/phosphomethylpyrimidine kinase [Oligoflexia bacterium]|nr:bifunctional hydroxymethylpyrimidine kinase/phosphomethylpyrimidine kinase [Oligoflexia bacterium]